MAVRRRPRLTVLVAVAALTLAACAGDESSGGTKEAPGGTFVFSQLAEPRSLDAAVAGTITSLQVTSQLFETLVQLEPGGTAIVPGLARAWEPSADGRAWTFRLQRGVRFHDGTVFDAAAVCANFERWHNFRGALQSPAASRFWRELIGGFAHPEGPAPPTAGLYAGCQARLPDEVVLRLTRPSGAFLSALTVPAFAIASPEALRRYDADRVSGGGEDPRFEGSFGTEHPVGTGPFRFERWVRGDRLVIVRNEDYWGRKAKLRRVVYRTLPDGTARRQALENGEIDGYDPVDPADIAPLRRAGFRILDRPPFIVGILAFNQSRPPLDNPKLRQAIAHALDREAVVRAHYQPGALVAEQFLPPPLWGRATEPPRYPHDPERAKALLDESGVAERTLELWYPTGLTGEPILPDPAAVSAAFRADLERVGFKVVLRPAPAQPDFVSAVSSGRTQLFLGGVHVLRSDPDAVLNEFQKKSPVWGFDDPQLFALLDRAEAETDQDRRAELYRQGSELLLELLPAVPFVHVKPAIALSSKVEGYRASPTPFDDFSLISVR